MIFTPTRLAGAYLIDVDARHDERGLFARLWCAREYAEHDLETRLVQVSLSYTERRGTLRGLHYQAAPHEEVKVVRCTRGAIYDVIVDLRHESATYLQHFGVELTAANRRQLYIPRGFAHGFQTLEDGCEVNYQMSEFYAPDAQRGLRWNDPSLAIAWPVSPAIVNERDRSYPDIVPAPRAMR